MRPDYVFFAGGGTGGHIYPGLAAAEKINQIDSNVKIHFFCSDRPIDSQILSKTKFTFTALNAKKFSFNPVGLVRFVHSFFESQKIASERLKVNGKAVVIGIGGFVSAPVCRAAYKLKIPAKLINVDIVPGKANKLCARWANEIFLQFEDTTDYFTGRGLRVNVTGCPLRNSFEKPNPERARAELSLKDDKKILLVTGASSGSVSINETICSLLDKLASYADIWQIVHLTGDINIKRAIMIIWRIYWRRRIW